MLTTFADIGLAEAADDIVMFRAGQEGRVLVSADTPRERLCDQRQPVLLTVDQTDLDDPIGRLPEHLLEAVDQGQRLVLGI